MPTTPAPTQPLRPLRGVRVLSLALNLPGPAALMRLKAMGAACLKAEPPPAGGTGSGDPMSRYSPSAHNALHQGIRVLALDLKAERGQTRLHRELARTQVLLTSFRPSALARLGLDWKTLHRRHPGLSVVAIVGAPGTGAELPGHDLTYQAEAGLVTGLDLPASLHADMGGALLASEAVLQAVLHQQRHGRASFQSVALSTAADWLALPRRWGLTSPGGTVGGAHAGYRVYPCRDGRVALAALEPHFAATICRLAGVSEVHGPQTMFRPETQAAIGSFLAGRSRRQIERLAVLHDLPLHTLA